MPDRPDPTRRLKSLRAAPTPGRIGWTPDAGGSGVLARPAPEFRRRGRHRRSVAPDDGGDQEPGQPADDLPSGADDQDAQDDTGPPAHDRGSAGWGRLAEKWVPDGLREARLDPGRRGGRLLTAVGAVAAVVAAVGVWVSRPDPRPVQAVALAPASGRPSGAPTARSGAPPPGSPPNPLPGSRSWFPSSDGAAVPAAIVVSVTGAVRRPGVVRLPGHARVADAIQAAGGVTDAADLTGLNLAQKLTDGSSVVVGSAVGAAGVVLNPRDPGEPQATGVSPAPAGSAPPLDLNTADQAALEALPGVGPVMASNIIQWRDVNGPFTSVDQLREISGIGPARFAQLAPLVSV